MILFHKSCFSYFLVFTFLVCVVFVLCVLDVSASSVMFVRPSKSPCVWVCFIMDHDFVCANLFLCDFDCFRRCVFRVLCVVVRHARGSYCASVHHCVHLFRVLVMSLTYLLYGRLENNMYCLSVRTLIYYLTHVP